MMTGADKNAGFQGFARERLCSKGTAACGTLIFRLSCVALLGFSIWGCGSNQQIVWSAESRSPDGEVVARAEAMMISGPGNSARWTSVSLRGFATEQNFGNVLSVAQDADQPVMKLTWLSPTRLQISNVDGKILFQAVKCCGGDVTIDVKEDNRVK
jgi:hypothetical protein